MKVLIWSDRSRFAREFIRKLRKERHEVYLIYNEKGHQEEKNIRGFEEYHLEYHNEHILTVVQNVAPDICLFFTDPLAAFEENKKYISYVSGLTNAVLSAKQAGVPKFYYRSSAEVYAGCPQTIIKEDTTPVNYGDVGNKILSCEQICRNHSSETFSTVILRCAEVYSGDSQSAEGNYVDCLSYAYTAGEPVTYDGNNYRSCIFYKDACDALYRILEADLDAEHPILVTGEDMYSEKEIARCFQEKVNLEVQEQPGRIERKRHQYMADTVKELGYTQRYSITEGIAEVCKNIRPLNEKRLFKNYRQKKWISFVETVAAFIVIQLFMMLTKGADFHNVIDVYMLFVLVIAVIHGAGNAVAATILSIVGRVLIGNTGIPLEGIQYYYWSLQLLIVATLAGFIKDKYKRRSVNLEDEKEYLDYELDYYKQLNQNGQEIKSIYEKRLLNYKNSFAKIADIVSGLDHLEPQKVIFEAVHVLERGMNSRGVCIYIVDAHRSYARLLARSGAGCQTLGKTFNMGDFPDMIAVLERGEVFVNKKMKPRLPIMAKALMNGGEIRSILMIYHLEFEEFGLQQSNTFTVLANLVEKSMNRAFQYYEDVKNQNYLEDTRVMKWPEFQKIADLYCIGEAEGLLEYTMLKVEGTEKGPDRLQQKVRDTDYIGMKNDGRCYVLLTNTLPEDTGNVIDRINTAGLRAQIFPKQSGRTLQEVYPELA